MNLVNNIKKFIEVNVKESKVELILTKANENDLLWNSLIEKTAENPRLPPWLKIDFDRWQPDESSEDETVNINSEVF